MYLVLNPNGRVVDISKQAFYARRQENGVVIRCAEADADAIYSANTDSFYPLEPTGYLADGHTLVEVDSVPSEVVAGYYFYHAGKFYTTEENLTALARAQANDVASLVFVSMAEKGEFDDSTLTEHTEQFPKWASSISYSANAIAQHGGKLYRCLQAHTSQEDWAPDVAASLWKEIGDPSVEYPAWSQPIGAVDAYQLGAKVSHNEKHWTSSVANNVWEPNVYGWDEA